MLKKIKKSNYTFLKIYRSIALLNTMSKVLKSIIINKITELTKRNSLLSKSQMNAKRKKDTKSTLKLLTEEIHTICVTNIPFATRSGGGATLVGAIESSRHRGLAPHREVMRLSRNDEKTSK